MSDRQDTGPFSQFSLAELQLIALGLWVIGQEERVDQRLEIDWSGLVARIRWAMQDKIAQELDR